MSLPSDSVKQVSTTTGESPSRRGKPFAAELIPIYQIIEDKIRTIIQDGRTTRLSKLAIRQELEGVADQDLIERALRNALRLYRQEGFLKILYAGMYSIENRSVPKIFLD
jgi:hypothetical protein